MSDVSLRWLYDRAAESSSVLEVGSWKGKSTHALLSGCKGPVFAVDHFKGNPEEIHGAHAEAKSHNIFTDFWQNVGRFDNLVVLRMDSVLASKFFAPRSIDMIFIDGSHTRNAVLLDLIVWQPKCRRLFCGHDIAYAGVRDALTDFGLPFTDAENSGGIWRIDVKT
jgi:predicted O-methyltransferase YrrM